MSTKRTTNEQVFSKIIEYVYAHMQHGAISIEAMADAVSLSTSQLNRRVKEVTGLTAGSLTPSPSPRGEGSGMPVLPEKDITPLSPRRGVGGEAADAAEDDGESLHLFISAKLKSSSKSFRDNICPR